MTIGSGIAVANLRCRMVFAEEDEGEALRARGVAVDEVHGATRARNGAADLLQHLELLDVLRVERGALGRALLDVRHARVGPHAVEVTHLIANAEPHAGEVAADRDDLALEARLPALERGKHALRRQDARALVAVNAAGDDERRARVLADDASDHAPRGHVGLFVRLGFVQSAAAIRAVVSSMEVTMSVDELATGRLMSVGPDKGEVMTAESFPRGGRRRCP